MAYRVLQGFCLGAGVDVHPGDEVELRDYEAKVYLQQGRIARIPTPEPAPETTSPAAAPASSNPETSSPPPGDPPAVTHRDPIATTRGRGRGRG